MYNARPSNKIKIQPSSTFNQTIPASCILRQVQWFDQKNPRIIAACLPCIFHGKNAIQIIYLESGEFSTHQVTYLSKLDHLSPPRIGEKTNMDERIKLKAQKFSLALGVYGLQASASGRFTVAIAWSSCFWNYHTIGSGIQKYEGKKKHVGRLKTNCFKYHLDSDPPKSSVWSEIWAPLPQKKGKTELLKAWNFCHPNGGSKGRHLEYATKLDPRATQFVGLDPTHQPSCLRSCIPNQTVTLEFNMTWDTQPI